MLRFETSKAHFVAFKTLMSTLFETPVLFSIFTFHSELQNVSLDRERTEKKTSREAIFECHYFICLHNKGMMGLRTDGRTDVRMYGHDVMTKFSELHGLLPFSLTNGCSASGLWPLELRYYLDRELCINCFVYTHYKFYLSYFCFVFFPLYFT